MKTPSPELADEVARKVLRLDLATLFPPQADQLRGLQECQT